MNETIVKPASEKQLKWLRDLLNKHDYSTFPAEWRAVCDAMKARFAKLESEGFEPGAIQVELEMAGKPVITNGDFEKLMPKLREAPMKTIEVEHVAAQLKAAIATTDGMFKKGDTFYKLRFAKTGKLWAHEDAKAFGALYGMCCNCGRLLTNEVSIYLGIGPVCGGRQFGGEFKFMISEAKLAVAPK
jgi:hypothetical protein